MTSVTWSNDSSFEPFTDAQELVTVSESKEGQMLSGLCSLTQRVNRNKRNPEIFFFTRMPDVFFFYE